MNPCEMLVAVIHWNCIIVAFIRKILENLDLFVKLLLAVNPDAKPIVEMAVKA